MGKKFDFSGWATRANMLCSDGRVIRKDAFKECDGVTVPLVWNHQHNSVDEVLGHALLENRDEGVYAYCTFNDTESGQNAKLLVRHGDVDKLSIYANKLKQQGSDVVHGVIRELSLVLAGANPGAYIESVMMHGDDAYEEGYICTGEYIENVESLFHSDDDKKGETMAEEVKGTKDVEELVNNLTEEQKKALLEKLSKKDEKSEETDNIKHAEETEAKKEKEKTIKEIINGLSPVEQKAVYALVGMALKNGKTDNEDEDDEDDEEYKGGKSNMKHNVFDNETGTTEVLSHADMMEILDDAKRNGSLADAVLQHGIEQIDYLFPDAKTLNNAPDFIKRDDTWVSDVMNAVHKTPFSRIKSVHADITETDARAKGYVKGNMKFEEVISLLKRVTNPTTIYKKQKLDRDDVIDITDFDVVAWLKTEMRMMLNEEIARAILVGDGRSNSSNDKINEQNVRPIWTDDDVYTIKAEINVTKEATDDQKAKGFITACIKSRKNYKGSGNPVMYISEDMLTNCLLLEDTNGRVIYDSIDKLATALRVRKIVPVPVLENLTRVVSENTHTLAGIYVNLTDYNIGADKGGAVNMFDDFDIDYNAMKYLIETRCSGALTKPFSAVALELVAPTN